MYYCRTYLSPHQIYAKQQFERMRICTSHEPTSAQLGGNRTHRLLHQRHLLLQPVSNLAASTYSATAQKRKPGMMRTSPPASFRPDNNKSLRRKTISFSLSSHLIPRSHGKNRNWNTLPSNRNPIRIQDPRTIADTRILRIQSSRYHRLCNIDKNRSNAGTPLPKSLSAFARGLIIPHSTFIFITSYFVIQGRHNRAYYTRTNANRETLLLI